MNNKKEVISMFRYVSLFIFSWETERKLLSIILIQLILVNTIRIAIALV